ncbi:MAG: hypothetical protein N3E44_00780, partial [Candidatus Bathyarchaeota archaeon]|nr:hypothetical protein [Candidatus Bathyarchaeota archaeon]
MKVAYLNSLDVAVKDDEIFSLIREGNIIHLVKLSPTLELAGKIASFKGSRAFLLKAGGQFLVCIDDALITIEDRAHRVVLKANRPENFFWHSVEVDGYVFIQEYGLPPTGIYVSEDLERWEKTITNTEIDKHSKHFHSIAWDRYRDWLIATLGDGCLTRIVYSEDFGQSWKPLYKGAWQFIPITPLKDKIVFGMDSGIARGGVGVYYLS